MRVSDKTWRIFKALDKTNPIAAWLYKDGAPRRDEIERQAAVNTAYVEHD